MLMQLPQSAHPGFKKGRFLKLAREMLSQIAAIDFLAVILASSRFVGALVRQAFNVSSQSYE